MFKQVVESAIGRRPLGRGDRAEPWTVVSALFASMFDDHTIEWLSRRVLSDLGSARPGRGNHYGRKCADRTAAVRRLFSVSVRQLVGCICVGEPDPSDLMRPFRAEPMRMWPISMQVNTTIRRSWSRSS